MALSMADQTKTSRGYVPVKGAEVRGFAPGTQRGEIVFDLISARDLASSDVPAAGVSGIEDLAVACRGDGMTADDIARLAHAAGPLFGRGDRERVSDWLSAMALAHTVVTMQEVLNGSKPLVPDLVPVTKSVARVEGTGTTFRLYSVAFSLGVAGESGYEAMLPELPLLRKFTRDGSFDYAFAAKETDGGRAVLQVVLLSFDREIAPADFAAAIAYFSDDPQAAAKALRDAQGEGFFDDALGFLSGADDLMARDVAISEEDFPHIQKLVYAIISLHLRGVRVDVFGSAEGDGFMTFDTYLSYLWFEFAKKLGQVRIGYCEQCGRGFSLTGHRGVARRFCSEACKTKAKNERARRQRDSVRRAFMEGASVADLAREHYSAEDAREGRARVIAQLKGWKTLQHELDAAIVFGGARRDLLARCIDEGVVGEHEVAERARRLATDRRLVRNVRKREGGGWV